MGIVPSFDLPTPFPRETSTTRCSVNRAEAALLGRPTANHGSYQSLAFTECINLGTAPRPAVPPNCHLGPEILLEQNPRSSYLVLIWSDECCTVLCQRQVSNFCCGRSGCPVSFAVSWHVYCCDAGIRDMDQGRGSLLRPLTSRVYQSTIYSWCTLKRVTLCAFQIDMKEASRNLAADH